MLTDEYMNEVRVSVMFVKNGYNFFRGTGGNFLLLYHINCIILTKRGVLICPRYVILYRPVPSPPPPGPVQFFIAIATY